MSRGLTGSHSPFYNIKGVIIMIEAVNTAIQTVAANATLVFSSTSINRGCTVRHRQGSGRFTALKPGVYKVSFQANVAIPTGGTAAPIILDVVQDGESLAGSRMISTPGAVNNYNSVSSVVLVEVYNCDSANIAIRNISGVAINVQDANIVIDRLC